jgi:hypothetical protein
MNDTVGAGAGGGAGWAGSLAAQAASHDNATTGTINFLNMLPSLVIGADIRDEAMSAKQLWPTAVKGATKASFNRAENSSSSDGPVLRHCFDCAGFQ